MKVFDFNVHLPLPAPNEGVNETIKKDLNLKEDGLISGYRQFNKMDEKPNGANFQLFNTNLFNDTIKNFRNEINTLSKCCLTALVDFRSEEIEKYIDRAHGQGVGAIMFNSYLQKIAAHEYGKTIEVCKYAEFKNMSICIDGSYGTSKMYTYKNLPLVCKVADSVTDVPIIIIHSGGANIIEAMLLAMDKNNVFLDTSFSLNFYLESSLEKDYAFAYKKLGPNKVLFGSDYPYHEFSISLQNQLKFFKRHNFSDKSIEQILYKNAIGLIE